jgi:polysaccharide deacetylase 2 family uncharacterized protein YibQ
MPKRSSHSRTRVPRAVLLLAALTLTLFLGGEALILARTESGQLTAAKYLRIGDPARLTQLVGRQVWRGLDAAHVPRDSVRESVMESGSARVRMRVGLRSDGSPLQVNYAVSRSLGENGAKIFSAREQTGRDGGTIVTLLAGVGHRPTHELVVVRPNYVNRPRAPLGARLAVVLYGFSDEPDRAPDFFRRSMPFAVALAPGAPWSTALFRAARESKREVVLSLPLEPINYPQVSPGPGTILVTMKPGQISNLVRRYLDQAAPVAAVANHMGSLATQDMTVMSAIYQELKRAGLPFLHVTPAPGAVCKSLAGELGLPYEEPDAMLDREARKDKPNGLDQSWNEVLRQARRRGHMIVMVRATPLTQKWLPQALSAKRLGDVSLVPISSLLRAPTAI